MFPACNYMIKDNNRNTRASCEICSRLTIKTPELRLNFEQVNPRWDLELTFTSKVKLDILSISNASISVISPLPLFINIQEAFLNDNLLSLWNMKSRQNHFYIWKLREISTQEEAAQNRNRSSYMLAVLSNCSKKL